MSSFTCNKGDSREGDYPPSFRDTQAQGLCVVFLYGPYFGLTHLPILGGYVLSLADVLSLREIALLFVTFVVGI